MLYCFFEFLLPKYRYANSVCLSPMRKTLTLQFLNMAFCTLFLCICALYSVEQYLKYKLLCIFSKPSFKRLLQKQRYSYLPFFVCIGKSIATITHIFSPFLNNTLFVHRFHIYETTSEPWLTVLSRIHNGACHCRT